MPELKPRSSELKNPELKPRISEMRRKDRVGAQVKPSPLVNHWIISAEAQDLRADTQDIMDETQHHRLDQIRTDARDLRAKAHDLSGLKPRMPELKPGRSREPLGGSGPLLGPSFGGLLGPPDAAGGVLGRVRGGILGASWGVLNIRLQKAATWRRLWAVFGAFLGLFWALPGTLLAPLGPPWGISEFSWSLFGPS